MFKVGDRVRLKPSQYGKTISDEHGVLLVVGERDVGVLRVSLLQSTNGSNRWTGQRYDWVGDDHLELVGPVNKITINTRRKW